VGGFLTPIPTAAPAPIVSLPPSAAPSDSLAPSAAPSASGIASPSAGPTGGAPATRTARRAGHAPAAPRPPRGRALWRLAGTPHIARGESGPGGAEPQPKPRRQPLGLAWPRVRPGT